MTVGSFNGKPKSTDLANSPFLGVDSDGIFQSMEEPSTDFVFITSKTLESPNFDLILDDPELLNFSNLFFISQFEVSTNNIKPAINMDVSLDGGSTWESTGYNGSCKFGDYSSPTMSNNFLNNSFTIAVPPGVIQADSFLMKQHFFIQNFNSSEDFSFNGSGSSIAFSQNMTLTYFIGGIGPSNVNALKIWFNPSVAVSPSGTITCYGLKT